VGYKRNACEDLDVNVERRDLLQDLDIDGK
jgi:hypothetical protein